MMEGEDGESDTKKKMQFVMEPQVSIAEEDPEQRLNRFEAEEDVLKWERIAMRCGGDMTADQCR